MSSNILKFMVCQPFDETYYQYSINSLEKFQLMERDDIKNYIYNNSNGIPFQDIHYRVQRFRHFVVDFEKNEIKDITADKQEVENYYRGLTRNYENFKSDKDREFEALQESDIGLIQHRSNMFSKFFKK